MSVNIYNSNPNASSEAENFQTVADRGSKLASDTIYSNTTSGLNSVNVQGAIDEINEKVEDNVEAISQINSDLSDIKTGNVTWNTTNKTSGTATLIKMGRICQLTLDNVTYSSLTHATTIFTVPDEFKPINRAWIPIIQVSTTLDATKDWATFPVALETDGNAIIYSTSGSASARLTSAKATITYISAN